MNNAMLSALRDLGTKSVGYEFTLHFTREFTSGMLVGLTHDDKIGFCEASSAHEWVSSVNRANAKGKLDYKVIKFAVRGTV